ncbi:MAG TPA: heparan-alpha-glucosaminide N-acetyltransferase [Casimicrobiaceae bacterium]|nr:heparan-alpha-glucosaminide N-acetyltransferase [Casimicrobiaceae bacterium]
MDEPPLTREATRRVPSLDQARGIAIVAMVAYHFCFDLRYFGLLRANFEYDLRWLTARTLILSSFLAIAGVSAVLAERAHPGSRRWLRHVGVIAAAALLVSAGSWLMFPQTWIWFGVLHGIAVSLVLARPLVGRPRTAALAGVAVIVLGLTLKDALFDNRMLGWLGFMTAKPPTEDYVPLFPWAGVLLLGVAVGHLLVRTRFAALAWLARTPSVLGQLGRHSLAVYLVHQPILIGALWLALRLG